VRRADRSRQRGFSFLEVLMAMSVLMIGSVAILSLFALGVNDLVNRKIDAKMESVRAEVRMILQERLDRTPAGQAPKDLPERPTDAPVALSQAGYSLRTKYKPSPFGGSGVVALATIYLNGVAIRLLPPIPLVRSTMDPNAASR
jgi:type II secretory pathway pseudopilin PulG